MVPVFEVTWAGGCFLAMQRERAERMRGQLSVAWRAAAAAASAVYTGAVVTRPRTLADSSDGPGHADIELSTIS